MSGPIVQARPIVLTVLGCPGLLSLVSAPIVQARPIASGLDESELNPLVLPPARRSPLGQAQLGQAHYAKTNGPGPRVQAQWARPVVPGPIVSLFGRARPVVLGRPNHTSQANSLKLYQMPLAANVSCAWGECGFVRLFG